jgi:hypothetical protein
MTLCLAALASSQPQYAAGAATALRVGFSITQAHKDTS